MRHFRPAFVNEDGREYGKDYGYARCGARRIRIRLRLRQKTSYEGARAVRPVAEIFKKLLPVLAPSSKAALISSRDAFLADGGNWMNAIRGGGARPLNVVVTKRFDNALENIGGLFSLPDDVRAVIVCESELY